MPEITVANLHKTFRVSPALDGVSFDVAEGEFLTLLGPSGCGKTTTLMTIAGFQRPDSGSIVVDGRTYVDAEAGVMLSAEQRNLGMVFQSYAIWPHMTVARNVAFPLRVRRVPRREISTRVAQTLDLVEMGDYADRYPHELSGGQQQRVALARALVHQPRVLLLDEPFSNLDAKLRERARTWLKNLQTELGITTVFVTHDQDEALSMSDRILVMDHGRILQSGPPEQVYQRPASRFVAEFLGQCNILDAHVAGNIGSCRTVVAVEPSGQHITIAATDAPTRGHVQLAVRPEAVNLTEQDPGSTNTVRAKIRSRSFLGDHYQYEVDADGLTLIATAGRAVTTEEVSVHIDPADCLLLTDHADTGSAERDRDPALDAEERTS